MLLKVSSSLGPGPMLSKLLIYIDLLAEEAGQYRCGQLVTSNAKARTFQLTHPDLSWA